MEIYLYNTLSGIKEKFEPIKTGKVGMYNCGPTVYNFVHIGNLRAYIFTDILRKTLEYAGYEVRQVMNITDIGHLAGDADDGEDKMTSALVREGKPLTLKAMRELAEFYTEAFKKDLMALGIAIPHILPFASDHIQEDIELIKILEEKGVAYTISDGIYFDTEEYPEYGKLGNISSNESESRIGIDDKKKNPKDFALWKFNSEIGWESPWGQGFPGWHIECSAMSMKYLEETFDIHTGGIDNMFPHHNNEIAQSECSTGKRFVNYWMHNAFLNIQGEKIAKSTGNIYTLEDLREKGFSPIVYRYLLLQAHYRSPTDFSWEAMTHAQNSLERLQNIIRELPKGGEIHDGYKQQFDNAISDDLDTPKALAVFWNMLRDENVNSKDKLATALLFNNILGILPSFKIEIPEMVQTLAREREEMRKDKDWPGADSLRQKIIALGYEVKDTDTGTKIYRL